MYQRYTFFTHSIRKCTSGTDFFAQNFWVYQQYSFFGHFWPILAIFWSFLGKNWENFSILYCWYTFLRKIFSFVPLVRTSGKSARIFFQCVPLVRTSCKSARKGLFNYGGSVLNLERNFYINFQMWSDCAGWFWHASPMFWDHLSHPSTLPWLTRGCILSWGKFSK